MSFDINIFTLDSKNLISFLKKRYNCEIVSSDDLKNLQKWIKVDFKSIESFRDLVDKSHYPVFEFLACLCEIFPKMFTSKTRDKLIILLNQMADTDLKVKKNVDPRKVIRNMASRNQFI